MNKLTASTIWPHALALSTAIVGQVVAYIPSWRPEAQAIISAGAVVIAFGILVYEAITRRLTIVKALPVAEADIAAAVRAELARAFGSATGTPTAANPVSQSPAVSGPQAAPAPTTPPAA